MSDYEYAEEQPIDGETILHCGHIEGKRLHWWKFAHEVYFRRPDGTVGTACWIAACPKCHRKSGGNGQNVEVRGDAIWTGDDPAIRKRRVDDTN